VKCCIALAALAGALLATPVVAQQSIDHASISGHVADPTGRAAGGARVSARHSATGITVIRVVRDDGRFRLANLRPGIWDVMVEQAGFEPEQRRVVVVPGSAFDIDVTLRVAGVRAGVLVTAASPLVETARTQSSSTLSPAEVSDLPLNGRQFLDLALLVPGVAPANVSSTQLFPETSAVPGISLSVNGQRNLSNSVVVDGVSANDDAAGLSGITYGVDAIEQVQVVTSGGQAELGRAMSGHVSIVTKSGTNELRGTAYGFVRDDSLNARNPLTGTTLPMDQWQFGGSAGGPLAQNGTFFFANAERRNLDQTGVSTISSGNVALINARLAAVGYGGPEVVTGLYPSPVDTTNVLGKVDHRTAGGTQFGFRYSFYDVGAINSRGAGGLSSPTASTSLANDDNSFGLSMTSLLGARTVLEARAQYTVGDLNAPPSDLVGPAVSIAGVAAFGRSSTSPTARLNRMTQLAAALSRQAGAHAVRAGTEFIANIDGIEYPRAARGSYAFSSMANFLAGAYNNAGFTQTFAVDTAAQSSPNFGVFVQDEWKVSSAVTLNLGLRYDAQWIDTVSVDADNLSPRLGMTWAPTASRRTLVRLNAGTYYDRVPLRAVANALLSAGNTTDVTSLQQIAISLSPTQAGAPVFPSILAAPVPTVTLPNLTTMDLGLQNARSQQVAAEFEQQIGGATVVTAGYHYLRGRDLLMAINQNVPQCQPSGNNNGCRPISAYANNSQYAAAGSSSYHGLHVTLARRPMGWGHYRVSYTLAKSMNNVGEFFFSGPIDPFDLSKDWARADSDRRHQLVMFASATAPETRGDSGWERLVHGFQASVMLQAYSALPLNITSGVTTLQGTAGRPIVDGEFIPRNDGKLDDFFSFNARLSRTFTFGSRTRLELMAEAFNLTNHTNAITRNGNFGTGAYPDNPAPGFGNITAVGEPRSVQVGARVRY
jgi:hypothetical protein